MMKNEKGLPAVGASAAPLRVCVLTQGIPHPSDGASTVLFYHYIAALVEAGYAVLSMVLVGRTPDHKPALKAYVERLGALAKNVSVQAIVRDGQALVPNRFGVIRNFGAQEDVAQAIKGFKPDIGLAFDLGPAGYLADIGIGRKYVWLGDLQFQSNWHHFLYETRERWTNVLRLPYALVQRRAWKRLYRDILSSFDDVIVSSHSSEAVLQTLGVKARFEPYPWPNEGGVDRSVARELPAIPTFLFYGHLFGLGSRSALHFLFEKLHPRLTTLWGVGGFRIIIGGRETPQGWAEAEIASRSELEYIGFIEDLDRTMAHVHAVIAPLDVPVGNRSRILTAMAKRVLVIAHANAAYGNPMLVDGDTCLLASDADAFVDRMRRAVEGPTQCGSIIDRGERAYLEHYAPSAAASAIAMAIGADYKTGCNQSLK